MHCIWHLCFVSTTIIQAFMSMSIWNFILFLDIIKQKGNVAYKLQLPPEMSAIFDVFHVSQLKRCLCIPDEAIAPTNIKLQSDLTYEEKSIQVLEEM